jgi:glycosyltransferase involved in cell wall biosynthesis
MRLRIGVVGAHLSSFSGIPRSFIAALRAYADVTEHNLSEYRPPLAKRVVVRIGRVAGREYLWEKDPARCAFQSRAIDDFAGSAGVDAIIVFGSEACAFCTTSVPLFGFGDSVFGTRIDMYDDQKSRRISARSIREGIDVQQRALTKMRRFFITSRWAWDQAQRRFGYRVDADRIEVTLIGANLPHIDAAPPMNADLRLLWVGVDWQRKRGELAVAVVAALRARGLDARLDVVGPVQPSSLPEWVTLHGSLSAATGLGDRFAASSALLLPTRGDLTPIVIAEAAMYGRAAVAPPVGGIPEMIDDASGILVDSDDPSVWAERIADAYQSGRLATLGAAARRRYETSLNWTTITRRIVERIA